MDVDPQETKRTVEFTVPIFNGVVDYPIAADVKGNKLIDIKPQVQRLPRDIWTQQYNQAFDIAKQNIFTLANMFTMNFNTGLKSIKINAPFLPAPLIQNYAEDTTSNGTWSVGGGASNLQNNNVNFVAGAGSLSFNLPSGSGYVENSTMSAQDLSEELNQGTFFLYAYMPTASQFSSVELRWGSSSSAYYKVSATQTQQGTAFQNGWNLLEFPWLGATVVGSPDVTAIDYLRVTYTTTAVQTAAGLNYVTIQLGKFMEYEYYSKYMFRDAITGAFQETVTDDSNLINLDTDSYNMLFNLVAFFAVQQQQGVDAVNYDGQFFGQEYLKCLTRYKAMYKSELQKPQGIYYSMPPQGYNRYFGRRWN